MKGGYQIIDLGGIDINSSQLSDGQNFVINGIYDKIEGTDKPVLIQNYSVDGIEEKPFFGTLISEDSGFAVYHQNYKIVFLSTATDTIQVIKAGNEEDDGPVISYNSLMQGDLFTPPSFASGENTATVEYTKNIFNQLIAQLKHGNIVWISSLSITDNNLSGGNTVSFPVLVSRGASDYECYGYGYANNTEYFIIFNSTNIIVKRRDVSIS